MTDQDLENAELTTESLFANSDVPQAVIFQSCNFYTSYDVVLYFQPLFFAVRYFLVLQIQRPHPMAVLSSNRGCN